MIGFLHFMLLTGPKVGLHGNIVVFTSPRVWHGGLFVVGLCVCVCVCLSVCVCVCVWSVCLSVSPRILSSPVAVTTVNPRQ